jgi:4-amino-4-deoxy-L-arabinose transferase-like glycosyltransferase
MNRRVILLEPLGVWLLSAILLTWPNLIGVSIHDEGFIASGGMLILRGKLPYRDFLSFYGPAQYYFVAGLFGLFGEDLIVLRLLHVAWLATLVLAVWLICRRVAKANSAPLLAVVAVISLTVYALPNPGYPSIPATILLLFSAFLLVEWHAGERSRALLTASVLVGLASLFRWDFGVFGLAALSMTAAIALWSRTAPVAEYIRSALHVAIPAIAIAAICYVPLLVIASDPRRWYHEVVEYGIYEFPKWRGNEFLRPAYWGLLHALDFRRVHAAFRYAYQIAYMIVPAGLSIAAIALMLRPLLARRRPFSDTPPAILYLALLGLVLLHQMRVRPTVWQGFPAVVAAVPLAVCVVVTVSTLVARWRVLTWTVRTAVAMGLAAVILAALPNARLAFDPDLVPLDPERAFLVRVPRASASYGDLVRYLRHQTSPSDFLYSGALDHSKLVLNDSMIYFLTDRLPADRFVELDPGIANTEGGQQELKDALETRHVPVIVLVALDQREPNLTSSSNGVFVLDQFIRSHYAEQASFGIYTVLRRTTPSR